MSLENKNRVRALEVVFCQRRNFFLLHFFPRMCSSAHGLAIESSELFVVACSAARVVVLSPDGAFKREWPVRGRFVQGIAVTRRQVFVSSSEGIEIFRRDGARSCLWPLSSVADSLAASPESLAMRYSQEQKVEVVSHQGVRCFDIALAWPHDLAFVEHEIFITASKFLHIYAQSDGVFLRRIDLFPSSLRHIALSEHGILALIMSEPELRTCTVDPSGFRQSLHQAPAPVARVAGVAFLGDRLHILDHTSVIWSVAIGTAAFARIARIT
jgi:hypothetical protein